MCGGDPHAWMCDECFAKMRNNPKFHEKDLCDECKQMVARMCFCCMVPVDDPSELDNDLHICKACQADT